MNVLDFSAIDPADWGSRLDIVCSRKAGGLSRSRLKTSLYTLCVNGKKGKLSYLVKKGDVIHLEWQDPIPQDIEGEDIPLRIVYEDQNITVVNKAQGMVTHPAAGNWSHTLVNALLWHWKCEVPDGSYRSGIVHRLDKDTSGLIITARNRDTEVYLQEEFKKRRVGKIYIALVCGTPKPLRGEIECSIIRDPKNRKRFTWTDDQTKGKLSKTGYRVVASFGSYSLVKFKLYTGRTHQIRVHCCKLGTPILGDPIYAKKDNMFPHATLMLHAMTLSIRVPPEGTRHVFRSPIPMRFKRIIQSLTEGTR